MVTIHLHINCPDTNNPDIIHLSAIIWILFIRSSFAWTLIIRTQLFYTLLYRYCSSGHYCYLFIIFRLFPICLSSSLCTREKKTRPIVMVNDRYFYRVVHFSFKKVWLKEKSLNIYAYVRVKVSQVDHSYSIKVKCSLLQELVALCKTKGILVGTYATKLKQYKLILFNHNFI